LRETSEVPRKGAKAATLLRYGDDKPLKVR